MNEFPDFITDIDRGILAWAQQAIGTSPILDTFFVVIGQWLVYFVPIALPLAWLWLRYGGGVKDWATERIYLIEFTLAGLLGWQVLSRIIKLFYFRPRPSVAGENVKELFFHRPDESFPSDHAALFFGFATYAYLLGWRKAGHWLLLAAILVSTSRIVTGTHWFTDILGGLVIGLLSAAIVWWLRVPIQRYIAEPLETFLSKIGL